MNERIKQLIESLGIIPEDKHYEISNLIIKECARISSHFSFENKRIHPDIDPQTMPEANRMVYHCTCQCVAHEIKEHFGVE